MNYEYPAEFRSWWDSVQTKHGSANSRPYEHHLSGKPLACAAWRAAIQYVESLPPSVKHRDGAISEMRFDEFKLLEKAQQVSDLLVGLENWQCLLIVERVKLEYIDSFVRSRKSNMLS